MAKTENIGLNLTEDDSTKFSTWRESIDGNGTGEEKSNMQILDGVIGGILRRLSALEGGTSGGGDTGDDSGSGDNTGGNETPVGYTITFYEAKNDIGDESKVLYRMTTDKNGKLSSFPTPTRDGYNFIMWLFESGGKKADSSTVFTGDTNLYGGWVKEEDTETPVVYTITFYNEEKDVGIESKVLYRMTTDENGKLSSLPTATREGYKFVMWTRIGAGQVTTSTVFTSDANVYALWEIDEGTGGDDTGGGEETGTYVYYGAAEEPAEYNSAFITSFEDKELSDGHVSAITANATSGKYIYYCFPSSFGTPRFTYNGVIGGFKKVAAAVDVEGVEYMIYRSTNSGLGSRKFTITTV